MRRVLLLLLTISFVFPLSIGEDPLPIVNVSFRLEERLWRNEFAPGIDWIENEGRSRMIHLLKEKLGFLDYRESGDSYNLEIVLKDQESATSISSELKEVVFELTLASPNIPVALSPMYGTFRSPADYLLPRGEKEVFLNEIMNSFKKYIQSNIEAVIDQLFSNIRIADKAYHVEETLYWIIPLKCKDLSICENPEFGASEFRIAAQTHEQEIESDVTKTCFTKMCGTTGQESKVFPQEYCGEKIITEAFWPENCAKNMKSGQITKVFMKKFIPNLASQGEKITASPDKLEIKD